MSFLGKIGHVLHVGEEKTVEGLEVAGEAVIHAVEDVVDYLPKLIQATQDAENVGKQLIPQIGVIVGDVKNIIVLGGEDGIQFLSSTKALWATLVAAAEAGGANVTLDLAVLPQVQAALAQAKTFENEIALFEKLYTDGVPLLSTIENGLATIEKDLGIKPADPAPTPAPAESPATIAEPTPTPA